MRLLGLMKYRAIVNVGFAVLHKVAEIESDEITKSSASNLLNDAICYKFLNWSLVIVTGMVNLAPESLPVTVIVVYRTEFEPNSVLTVVAFKLILVPTTVLDTLVPNVCCLVCCISCWSVNSSSCKCRHGSYISNSSCISRGFK